MSLLKHTDKSLVADVASNPAMWIDRNIAYHVHKIVDPDDKALSMELLCFLCDVFQTNPLYTTVTAHGAKALIKFTHSEFADWSKQSRASLARPAGDWSYQMNVPGLDEPLVVTSRLDKALHFLANNPINVQEFVEIYKRKLENKYNDFDVESIMVNMKAPTVIETYMMNISEERHKERIYLVKLNSFIRHSLISENLSLMSTDLPKLRGKGNYHDIYWKLVAEQNTALLQERTKGKAPRRVIYYNEMKRLCNVHVEGYTYKKNISREKQRINKKLDYLIKNTTQISFSYSIDSNNNYIFYFKKKSFLQPHEHKTKAATENHITTLIAEYVDGITPKKLSDLHPSEFDSFLNYLVDSYDFNQARNIDYHQSFVRTILSKIGTVAIDKATIEQKIKSRTAYILSDIRNSSNVK